MSIVLNMIVLTAAAYLIGSIPVGVMVGRAVVGRDIRESGSGHAGATNTMRQAGWGAGILVLALDIGKGFVAEWLALRFGTHTFTPMLAGAAAVAGQCWPIFGGFRGGMGMATAGGTLLAAYPLGFVLGVGLAALGSLVLRHSARGNILTGLLIGPAVWLTSRSANLAGLGVTIGAVIAFRALSDWRRVYRELWLDRGSETFDKAN
jgi:glycerol-3-phosphate acyltransferase PlsY